MDSVGFNYLNADMTSFANEYQLNINDLLDIFHTFNVSLMDMYLLKMKFFPLNIKSLTYQIQVFFLRLSLMRLEMVQA
jgi:hypothetical protein